MDYNLWFQRQLLRRGRLNRYSICIYIIILYYYVYVVGNIDENILNEIAENKIRKIIIINR